MGVTILAAVAFASCSRSPTKLGARFSGLDVPGSAEVIEFKDEASGVAGEDLFVRVVLRLEPDDFSTILAEAQAEGYVSIPRGIPLPQAGSELGLPEAVWGLLEGVQSGLVRFEADSESSWSIAVVDRDEQTLTVEYVIV